MTSLTRFALGFGAGLGVALGIFFGLFYWQLGAPTESSRWCYELNAKKRQLAGEIQGPKLLLAGGSSTLFGLSAKRIQEETGYPTVNLGTHASLGSYYILRLVQQAAKPGDTVLLAFEYEVYDWGIGFKTKGWNDSLYYDYLFARDPEFFRLMPVWAQFQTAMLISNDRLKQGLRALRRKPGRSDYGIYDIKYVNTYGDQVGHTATNRPAGAFYLYQCSQNLAEGLSAAPKGYPILAVFCQWARANHVRVLATFPSICERAEYLTPKAEQTPKAIRNFFTTLGVTVIGDAREAILPPELFYDTMYHLTEEGAQEHTRRLLTRLAPLLKKDSATAKVF